MALKSMTGFGRGEASLGRMRADVEISSVNRKQIDVHVSLPKGLAALESRLTKEISKSFSRGCISASVRLVVTGSGAKGACVDAELARDYISSLRTVARDLGLKDDLSASALAGLPNVVRPDLPVAGADDAWPVVRAALEQALVRLSAMRCTEGAALRRDILKRSKRLGACLRRISGRSAAATARHREALRRRLAEAGAPVNLEDPLLRKELLLFADRCDISEETTRLASHLAQATGLLDADAPLGRTLDFIVQEMFREITTIGSKANDAAISGDVILFKTELERIREQVQNVE